MNILGIPLQVTLTDLPTGNTPAETPPENITIYEDDITAVLWQRWIACYMLYDWNMLQLIPLTPAISIHG